MTTNDSQTVVGQAEDLLDAVAPTAEPSSPASHAGGRLGEAEPRAKEKPPPTPSDTRKAKPARGKRARTRQAKPKAKAKEATTGQRARTARSFPAAAFEEALELPLAIQQIGGGEKVRRLTLFEQLDKSPESGTSRQMITNASRYGLTSGSYQAEWLELTQVGRVATSNEVSPREQLRARFTLAIERIDPFKLLYDRLRDHRVPTHAVMRDILAEAAYPADQLQECVDTFIVNAKFLGLLRPIAGSERLISIEQLLDELPAAPSAFTVARTDHAGLEDESAPDVEDWTSVCFYVAPIGAANTEARQHSDLILASLVEPAVAELGLTVVRADGIEKPGVITKQVIEHVAKARLVIADLSFHNPNVFYELALRHATGKPTIHLIRKGDPIPFDIGQFRTIHIDTTDLYAFVPQMETYRAEIATHARRALDEEGTAAGPLSVYYPEFAASLRDVA